MSETLASSPTRVIDASLAVWAVLREVAARAGVDVPGMEAAVKADRFGDYLDARRHEAEELGINGIPAHIIAERYLVMGAQPYDLFERVMAKVRVSRRDARAIPEC